MIKRTGPILSALAVAAFIALPLLATPADLEAQRHRPPYNHDRATIAAQPLQQSSHPRAVEGQLASVAAALERRSLTVMDGTRLPAEVQRMLLSVLKGSDGAGLAERLAPEHNLLAADQALALVVSLQGLLAEPSRVGEAAAAYNALIDASTEEFLRAPPLELLAVRAVLAQLLEGARPGGQ